MLWQKSPNLAGNVSTKVWCQCGCNNQTFIVAVTNVKNHLVVVIKLQLPIESSYIPKLPTLLLRNFSHKAVLHYVMLYCQNASGRWAYLTGAEYQDKGVKNNYL